MPELTREWDRPIMIITGRLPRLRYQRVVPQTVTATTRS